MADLIRKVPNWNGEKKPKLNIPTHDPQTGELNPHYKDLTSKKNPLLTEVSTKDKTPKMTYSIGVEPKRDNRFIVRLKEADIQEWAVQKVNRPTYNFKTGWAPITIEYLDPIGPSTSQAVFNDLIDKHIKGKLPKICTMTILGLDPCGVTIEEWEIKGEYVSIDFSNADYGKDTLQKVTIMFQPTMCTLKY